MSSEKLSYEDFFKKAILKLRDTAKSRGIHSVFSGSSQAFRDYFGEDPVAITQRLAETGEIQIRPVKRGVMIYLPGEAPQSRSELGKQALSRILGEPGHQHVDLVTKFIENLAGELKSFPSDFLQKDAHTARISLPRTPLQIETNSTTMVVSPKGHFRYEAKNPPLARYILYGYQSGQQHISIPTDNHVVFRAVTAYEKYCDVIREKAFSFFLESSKDEEMAELLTKNAQQRLDLRAGNTPRL